MTSRIPRGGLSLYVHVPFCASKCSYCDFYSLPMGPGGSAGRPDDTSIDGYLSGLRTLSLARPLLDDVPTLYVGGGTPSVLGERLADVFRCLRVAGVVLRPGAEVTVEATPESVPPRILALLAEEGVTRVSLGIQSFDDEVLEILGRCHDAERARSAARAVTEAGFRLSIDLMCGIPGQSAGSWTDTLREAGATGAGHLSVYPLAVEPSTPMAAMVERGELPEPDPDMAASMMLEAEVLLGDLGAARYEVANYARPGEESLHNLRYWTGGAYLGVGPAAASMLPGGRYALLAAAVNAPTCGDAARVRFTAPHRAAGTGGFFEAGIAAVPDELECMTAAEAAREDAMLGMRLVSGITDDLAVRAEAVPSLKTLVRDGLVEHAGGSWRTTRRGWLLGNEVFGRIWNG